MDFRSSKYLSHLIIFLTIQNLYALKIRRCILLSTYLVRLSSRLNSSLAALECGEKLGKE